MFITIRYNQYRGKQMKKTLWMFISFIGNIYKTLAQVYMETWEDEILAESLNERINEIKEENRAKYIGFAAGVYTHEASKKGMYLPETTAARMAQKSFIDSVLKDELDELYNVKGESDEDN